MQAAKKAEGKARSFGAALYASRVKKGWTVPHLASHVGVSNQVVKNWENDAEVPKALQLKKLYGVFYSLRYSTDLLPKIARDHLASRMYATGEEGKEELWIPPSPTAAEEADPPRLAPLFHEVLRDVMTDEDAQVKDLGGVLQVTDATIQGWLDATHAPTDKQFSDLVVLYPQLAATNPREDLPVNSEPREQTLAIVPSEETKEPSSRRTIVQVPAKAGTPGRSIQMASTAPQRPTPPQQPAVGYQPPLQPVPAPPQPQLLASPQPFSPPPLWQPNPNASSGPIPPLGQSHRVRSNVEVAGVRHANARLAVKQAQMHIADIKAQLAEAERELAQRMTEAAAAQQDLDTAIDNAT